LRVVIHIAIRVLSKVPSDRLSDTLDTVVSVRKEGEMDAMSVLIICNHTPPAESADRRD
jgi:hypothetical protein